MSTSAAPTVRCPACAATLRAGSDWCTLCYADLRPAPTPPATPPSHESDAGAAAPVLDGTVGAPDGTDIATPAPSRPRGKHARRDPAYEETSKSPDEVEALASQMLAQLAASESKNPLGPIAGAVDTTGKRAVLMVGGAVVAMLLLFVLMAILGAIF